MMLPIDRHGLEPGATKTQIMPFRQQVFLILGCLTLLLSGLSVSINSNQLFHVSFVFALSLLYRYLPTRKIPNWYFWLHAALCFLPLTCMALLYSADTPATVTEESIAQVRYSQRWEEVFVLNQLVFIGVLYVNPFMRLKRHRLRQQMEKALMYVRKRLSGPTAPSA
jgi:hypothetical protein